MACSGCGGGGSGGGAPAAVPQAATPQPKSVLIEAYGDSTMYGFAATSMTTGAYTPDNAPFYLQQDLEGIYGAGVTVSDQGVGGKTLGELIAGTDGVHPTWAQQMAQSKAQIVIENHGLNDAYPAINESADQFRADLVEFVSTARQYGKTPVLEEPNPSCDPLRSNLNEYVQKIDDVSAQMGVPLVQQYAYIQSLPSWQSYLADCIHPNPAMYQIKAQREAVVLSPLVAKLL